MRDAMNDQPVGVGNGLAKATLGRSFVQRWSFFISEQFRYAG